jgi:presenilin-like A22 family membrane protease
VLRKINSYFCPEWFVGEEGLSLLDFIGWVNGAFISISWYFTKNWVLNNILALSLCFLFLKTLRLNKLLPGVIFLCLLFFYDIFMVFFTPHFTSGGKSVMVTVALGIEAPIKLLMPHISIKDFPTNTCSMLGLGDIVIPGLFIGFLIRFGRYKALSTMLPTSRHVNKNYRNPYTCPSLTAYVFSLFICGSCLILFNSA